MIIFTKTLTADNGAVVVHHRPTRVEMSVDMLYMHVFLDSWPTAELRTDGQPPLARWMARKAVADCDFSDGMASAVTDTVLSSEWFGGATVSSD